MGSSQEDMVAAVLAELGKAVPIEEAALAFSSEKEAPPTELSQPPVAKSAEQAPPSTNEQDNHRNDDDDDGSTPGTTAVVVSFPVEPRVVQFVKISKSRQDHSYRDFSIVPAPTTYEPPSSIESMSFSEKLHDILSAPENSKTIRWMSHGRAFHVDVPKNMEKLGILMKYFHHGRYSSFLRQLNNHGFKHLTVGPDRNCYYHECFLRGLPHLCSYMPPAKDARRLIPDPDNEPNFYAIGKTYPLPGHGGDNNQEEGKATPITAPVSSQLQQANTDSMPRLSAVQSATISSMDQVSPFAARLGHPNGDVVIPQAAAVNRHQAALFQPGNFMLPPVLVNAMAQSQGTTSSITNSLLAAISQDTLNFPNYNTNYDIAASLFGNTTTSNSLESLMARQSSFAQVTQKRYVESPTSPNIRPAKMLRLYNPSMMEQVLPTSNAAGAPASSCWSMTTYNDVNDDMANRRIQDVAQSFASMEKFRSEAQRLDAARKKTEELQKAATANALAAQAALLAAILNGSDGTGNPPENNPDFFGHGVCQQRQRKAP